MVVTSLKTMEEIRQGTLLTWPSSLNFDSWLVAWGGRGYGAGDTFLRPYFWNSIKMVVPAVFFSTFIGAMTGYVLTKWRFKGDQWVFLFLLFGCFIPFQAILLPMARTLGTLGIQKMFIDWGFENFTFDWLVNREMAIYTIVIAGVWQSAGFVMALFLAGLRSVEDEIVKAAKIDGAGLFTVYWKILLPMMRPVFFTSFVILVHISIKSYDLIVALTQGGPGISTTMPALFMTQAAFHKSQVGLSAASAMMMFMAVAAVIIPYLYSELRRENAR